MEWTVHATAPTRADLAGGTLDVWPVPQVLRQRNTAKGDDPGAIRGPIVTINAGIELRTSCLAVGQRRTESDLTEATEFVIGGESFFAARPSESARLIRAHPLVGAACLELLPEVTRGLRRISLTTASEVPRGSGLGGSSSLLITVIAAIKRLGALARAEPAAAAQKAPSEDERFAICRLACGLEAGLLGGLAGIQDHYGAAFGQIASYELNPDGSATRCPMPSASSEWLENHALLVLSGDEHHSGATNGRILKALFDGEPEAVRLFDELAKNAAKAKLALENHDFETFASAAGHDWTLRRAAFPLLTTPAIEGLSLEATRAGAKAIKVCGAAAGGVLLVMYDGQQTTRTRLISAMERSGARMLPMRVAKSGLVINTVTA